MNYNVNSISRLVKICISIVILLSIFFFADLSEIWNVLTSGNPLKLFIGFLLLTSALTLLQSIRLFYIIKGNGISFRNVTWLTLVGIFFNAFLPSNVGGDAIKIFYLQKRKSTSLGNAVTYIILHRMSGLIVLLFGGLFYLFIHFKRVKTLFFKAFSFIHFNKNTWILLGVLVILLFVLLPLLKRFSPPIKANIDQFIQQIQSSLRMINISSLIAILSLAALFHALRVFSFIYFLEFSNATIGAFEMVFILAVVALIALLPITIGGLGLVEGTITIMLVIFGIPQTTAVTVSLLHRFILLVLSIVGGICYFAKDWKN